jgi:hypothetical protein
MKEFLFGNKVKVIGGFYKGCYGILLDSKFEITYGSSGIFYDIDILKIDDNNCRRCKTVSINEKDIELV